MKFPVIFPFIPLLTLAAPQFTTHTISSLSRTETPLTAYTLPADQPSSWAISRNEEPTSKHQKRASLRRQQSIYNSSALIVPPPPPPPLLPLPPPPPPPPPFPSRPSPSSSTSSTSPSSSPSPSSTTSPSLSPSQSSPPSPTGSGSVCGGSSNGCWGQYSIEDDPETTTPTTNRVVEYNFTITNTTCSPDGIQKPCLLINNQFPGPTIEANWGDTFQITVNNQLQDNGTSIHWHGMPQRTTNDQDGVNGITECPIAPGQSRVYQFRATTYGTSWYHSHFSMQYGDGIAGPIVIHGPTSSGYDVDLGPVAISETYNGAGSSELDVVIATQGPDAVVPDNILFNGMNVNANGGGKRLQMNVDPGKKYLMRFVNIGIQNFYKVGIDNHMMQVVALDFQPVKPYSAQYVSLGIGQRVDVIVTANATVGNYYLRAIPGSCYTNKNNGKGIQNAIISYTGASSKLPSSTPAPVDASCLDEPAEKTIPFVKKSVDISTFDPRQLPISSPFQTTSGPDGKVFRWSLGNTTMNVEWESPILQRIIEQNTTISQADNVNSVDEKDTWVYWYIQNTFNESHPLHMHGNFLRILEQGDGQWDQDVTKLQISNPMRRDTFMVPASGYTVIAFYTDNPGAWLFHCHIGFHASEGLSTTMLVRRQDISINTSSAGNIEGQCKAWDQYTRTAKYRQFGSGL